MKAGSPKTEESRLEVNNLCDVFEHCLSPYLPVATSEINKFPIFTVSQSNRQSYEKASEVKLY